MIPDWETNQLFVSDRLEADFPDLISSLRSLNRFGINLISGTSDIWCRDFMPIQIGDGTFRQFVYSPDYLRGRKHLITPAARCLLPIMEDFRQEPLALDGGNVVASQSKAILTDKIFKENRSIHPKKLKDRLESIFQVECVIIPHEPYDYVGHADGMVRFVSENHVLINDYSTVDPRFGEKLRRLLERQGLSVDTIPLFHERQKHRGQFQSAVGIYTNFLRVGEIVVIPTFDLPADEIAWEIMQRTLPNATVIQLPCRKLARQGGVLNCISWTIKAKQ